MDIEIGSNLYRNSNGVIDIEGVPLAQLAVKPSNGALLVNFALFDQAGRMVAKIVDSTLAFNEKRAYELNKSPNTVELKEIESGKLVLRLEQREPDRVVINKASFWTIKGHLCEISPTECRIDRHRLSGGDTDAKGGAAAIG
ncbi:hypothetical protein DNFV4_02428 [Nitrospira tepida]|uniref:Uncharacterized protein n=1 Tax=Nitrospira tepida TaxID=2973512 RepID=A0AA86MZP5_9BACT|nr:hypothetical protein [Nitrospira tepida]CAI4032004.1 hypothetical protein DNFV4_02428 [Nitrospira tepida]